LSHLGRPGAVCALRPSSPQHFRSREGGRKLRPLACTISRTLIWSVPVHDEPRRAVEAADAFGDGAIRWGGPDARHV
jgi:hypothetical protein